MLQQHLPFTVLKPHWRNNCLKLIEQWRCNSTYRLRYWNWIALIRPNVNLSATLQQHLPFTVLKHKSKIFNRYEFSHGCNSTYRLRYWNLWLILQMALIKLVATVLTVHGIETKLLILVMMTFPGIRCNSPYRSRYWNKSLIANLISLDCSCNSAYRLRYWNSTPSGTSRA